jgi:hypothetical protein
MKPKSPQKKAPSGKRSWKAGHGISKWRASKPPLRRKKFREVKEAVASIHRAKTKQLLSLLS